MDALPLELYLSIFDFLDLNDLLTMRLVSKRFESAVREFRIEELTFLDYYFYLGYSHFTNVWFSSEKTREQRMLFLFSKGFLSRGPCKVQFLRRLYIWSLRMIEGIDLEVIARFQHLECLEIGFDLRTPHSFSLSLPNLRALRVIEFLHKEPLEVVAPKLQALELPWLQYVPFRREELSRKEYLTVYLSQLTFRHPQTVRYLFFHEDYLSFPYDPLAHEPYLNQFESVDCIEIKHLQNHRAAFLSNFDPDRLVRSQDRTFRLDQLLLKFPNLKRIYCNVWHGYLKKAVFANLIRQLRDLERSDLKMFSNDIELSGDPILIEDFDRCRRAYLSQNRDTKWDFYLSGKFMLQLRHYSKLNDRVKMGEWIDYSELEAWLGSMQVEQGAAFDRAGPAPSGGLPIDFFKRFPFIRGIRVTSRISDPDALVSFVKNCNKLKQFSSSGSELGQAFFDQLPVVSSLNFLEIEEASDLDMQFLLRMNRLVGLKTNQQLTTKIARYFFGMRFGYELVGKIQNNSVKGSRIRRKLFSLEVNEETTEEQLTFEGLIEQFSSLERGRSSDDGPPLKIFKSSVVS